MRRENHAWGTSSPPEAGSRESDDEASSAPALSVRRVAVKCEAPQSAQHGMVRIGAPETFPELAGHLIGLGVTPELAIESRQIGLIPLPQPRRTSQALRAITPGLSGGGLLKHLQGLGTVTLLDERRCEGSRREMGLRDRTSGKRALLHAVLKLPRRYYLPPGPPPLRRISGGRS